MPTAEEKQAFSLRLKQALKRSNKKINSAAALAIQFNLRYKDDPITTQAAQKWLKGQAFPRIEKIATLAEWLNVSLHWLRFGVPEERPSASGARSARKAQEPTPPTSKELEILTTLRQMPEDRRNLVFELIDTLSLDQKMWRE